jgi:hypothetical protein
VARARTDAPEGWRLVLAPMRRVDLLPLAAAAAAGAEVCVQARARLAPADRVVWAADRPFVLVAGPLSVFTSTGYKLAAQQGDTYFAQRPGAMPILTISQLAQPY